MYLGPIQKIVGWLNTDGEQEVAPMGGAGVAEALMMVQNEYGDVTIEPRPDVLDFDAAALRDGCPDASIRSYKASRSVLVKTGSKTPTVHGVKHHVVMAKEIPPTGTACSPERALWLLNRYPMLLQEQDPDAHAFPNGYDADRDDEEETPVVVAEKPKRKPRARKPASAGATPKKPRRKVAKVDADAPADTE